jgi:serine/threonine protein kinase/tetratricopeptide (TPR) repeat protein
MSTEVSLDTIFGAALDIESAQTRAAYLDRACGEDTSLRRRVEQLLEAHVKAGGFLQLPDTEPQQTVDQAPLAMEEAGTRIGPYKLLQQLGKGGMGVVWLAEQDQPVRRKVALKIIKPGMDSLQVITRFEQERQALALMDHVNIARVFDAGTTQNGRPFFVMEVIQGIPITKYCDDNQLTLRQRLELFVPVCLAVQHAHQKGIIHRDLKPSNVLVAEQDGKPAPKVIDFGVAKAIEQRLTEQTLCTQYGTILGTFEYMSPEQAEMSASGVDTRSDIYSLGVLLYKLLTGTTPLERQRLRDASYAEKVRMIREEEPPKPSTRLSHFHSPSAAAVRQMEPAKLAKLVRGELDWIVMKALEKDRNRRYATANGLARDIEHYLHDEIVEARPPSAVYRLRKLARRHKQALAVMAAALLGLMVLACTIGYFLYERQTGRIEAETKQRQAIETALDKASGLRQKGHWAEARLELEQARDRLGDIGAADLRRQLDRAAADLDLVDRLESIRLRRVTHNNELNNRNTERDYAAALREGGLGEEGDDAQAVALRIRVSAICEQVVAALDDWAAITKDAKRQAWLLEVARRADPDDWRDLFRDPKVWRDRAALKELASELLLDEAQLARQKPQHVVALANVLEAANADAVPLLEAAQARHPDDFWLNLSLGKASWEDKRWDESASYSRAAVALRPESAAAHNNLGRAMYHTKQLDKAIREYRTAIKLDPEYAWAHYNLGLVFMCKGRLDEAMREYRKTIDLEPKFAPAHNNLAWLLATCSALNLRDPERAVESAKKAVELAPTHGNYWNTLGAAHYRAGQWKPAVQALNKSMDLQKGGDSSDWFFLAMAHWRLGEEDQARRWYDRAVQWMDKNNPKNDELRRFREEAVELLGKGKNYD